MNGPVGMCDEYAELYERARHVLGSDRRVARVELAGSFASETADAWSDLDVRVVADPDHFDSLLRDWPTWLARITPTVFARAALAPFIINTVTAEGLTFDLAVYAGEAPQHVPAAGYSVGMLARRPFATLGEALEYAVEEQIRGLCGPFITLLRREEHLRHLAGVPHLIGLLTTVFLAETGAPPPGKRWNDTFTAEQRAASAALPAVRATHEDLVAFGLGVAKLIVERARPLYPQYGLSWPHALAAVASDRLRAHLAIDAHDWLH